MYRVNYINCSYVKLDVVTITKKYIEYNYYSKVIKEARKGENHKIVESEREAIKCLMKYIQEDINTELFAPTKLSKKVIFELEKKIELLENKLNLV